MATCCWAASAGAWRPCSGACRRARPSIVPGNMLGARTGCTRRSRRIDNDPRERTMSMPQWQALLLEPDGLRDEADYPGWFDAIARRLLCGCRLMIGTAPHRFTEVEFYYQGRSHLDPF